MLGERTFGNFIEKYWSQWQDAYLCRKQIARSRLRNTYIRLEVVKIGHLSRYLGIVISFVLVYFVLLIINLI